MSRALLATLVMTVIGPDRPGLVEGLAVVIARHGGNWLDSRMAHFAGEFAGILRVQIDAASAQALLDELEGMKSQGIQMTVQSDNTDDSNATEGRQIVRFHLVGQDRPGIVAQISRVLAARGANVEDLQTGCKSAPMTGDTLFEAQAVLSVPEELSIAALREDLERIAADLMVDLVIQD